MFNVILLLLSFSFFAQARESGFSKGHEFVATPIQGQVRVVCNGFNGTGAAAFNCRDVALDPAVYDYFVGPIDSRADRVELYATHEDGSFRVKAVDYDGVRGRSREAFNLWISTLFQKPLLEFGKNSIRFKIYSGSNLIEEISNASFMVNVKKGPARTCPVATYNSTDINDCSSQYSICQRYFEEYRNCQ